MNTARSDRTHASRLPTSRTMRSDEGDARSVAGSERGDDGDVPMDVAEAVLQSSRDMRRVHSSRSIRGILDKKKVVCDCFHMLSLGFGLGLFCSCELHMMRACCCVHVAPCMLMRACCSVHVDACMLMRAC